MSSIVECPRCHAETTGNYCDQCGSPLARECPTCGSKADTTARYCAECGTALREARAGKIETSIALRSNVPWLAMGAAGAVLAIVGAFVILDRSGSEPAPAPASLASEGASASGQPVDLSSMSPREAADRLFNRIMTAKENGDQAEAENFVPMALQAYELVGTLGNDEHYHLGLLHMVVDDVDAASAELDAIRRDAPEHLLGYLLAHDIASSNGDEVASTNAYAGFLAAYETELRLDRQEYLDHRKGLESFRGRAAAASQ